MKRQKSYTLKEKKTKKQPVSTWGIETTCTS